MRKELPKQYDPKLVEDSIYQMWMENDCFHADPDPDKKPYSIVMPPPMSRASSIWAMRWTPRFRTS